MFSKSALSQANQNYADRLRLTYQFPGWVYAVFNEDSCLEMAGSGVRGMYDQSKVSPQQYFHIGSNTKAITAFIALQMVREGLIRWDSYLLDAFPPWKDNSRKEYAFIQLSDLLNHRTSLPPYWLGRDINRVSGCLKGRYDCRRSFAQEVLTMKPHPLRRQQTYSYSNTNYVMAALMLEQASGKSWETLVDEYVNQRLNTSFRVGWPQPSEGDPYGHWRTGKKWVSVPPNESFDFGVIFAPAGDLNARLQDMYLFGAEWIKALQGKSKWITREEAVFCLYGFPEYALGWEWKVKEGIRISYHEGTIGTFHSMMMLLPARGIGVVIMVNASDTRTFLAMQRLRSWLLKQYDMVPPINSSAHLMIQ